MKHAFVFERIAVLVFPWHEPGFRPERGARVEVRILDEEPRRGSPSAAQRVVIDQPLFRADLFDEVDGPPGNLRAAHFHPHFDGVEPCERTWPGGIRDDPTGWLATQLSDLPRLLEQSGFDAGAAAWIDADTANLRDAVPAVVAAVEATWSEVRQD